jgi:predicted O-linked N-acetylglucosamine transferase (SPINDLY family)
LMYKPAPVIISWLGSLTTTAIAQVDYVFADRYVFTADVEPYYIEKPIFLETGMHLHDSQRVIGEPLTRSEFGVPEDAFVYCCFNNNYKITPHVFSVWMQILQKVPQSILWLLADNEWSQENLLSQARHYDVDPSRIVFAQRILPDQYLARYRLADVFLDTHPYNAGTTAIDCLYSGLPIITCAGVSVASRVAGGVLTHAGLPELIAGDWDQYVSKAVQLANKPDLHQKIKKKIASAKVKNSKLFNTSEKVQEFMSIATQLVAERA